MIDLLIIKHLLETMDWGLIGNEFLGGLFAITMAYFLSNRGEEIRLLFLPMVLAGQIKIGRAHV